MTSAAAPITERRASVVNTSVTARTIHTGFGLDGREVALHTQIRMIDTSRLLATASGTPTDSGVCASGPTSVPAVLVTIQRMRMAALPSTPAHTTPRDGDLTARTAQTS